MQLECVFQEPLRAIAPSSDISSWRLALVFWVPLVLSPGDGKAPSLNNFLILVMSEISDNVWSSKGTGVPWTEASRCVATESRVISGDTETLTASRSLVESVTPNFRNESAIYWNESIVLEKWKSQGRTNIVRRIQGEYNLRVHIVGLESIILVVIDSSKDSCGRMCSWEDLIFWMSALFSNPLII